MDNHVDYRPVVLVSTLHDGAADGYEAAHRVIPDDLYDLLVGAGVRDWAIWRDGQTLLHMVDIDDYAALGAALADDPVNDRWQAEMAQYVAGFTDVTHIPVLEAPRLVWSMRRQRVQ